MPRPLSHRWFRIWAPEMFGEEDPDGFNMIEILGPQERWCWFALCGMCAMSPFQPAICKQPFVGFSDSEIVTMMRVHSTVWKECKQKLVFSGKIVVDIHNVIVIIGWERNAAKYFRGREYKDGLLFAMTAEDELRQRATSKAKHELFARVIRHLNEKTGRNYHVSSKASFRHFSARFDEGNDWEDFKHVIDVKVQRWLGSDEYECYLRPETLFGTKFESYRQERLIVRKHQAGEPTPLRIMPEERKKYEEQAKLAFEQQKAIIMKDNNVEDEDGWYNLMFKGKAFTFEEFFEAYIKKLRQSPVWSLEQEEE